MLNVEKLKEISRQQGVTLEQLAEYLVHGNVNKQQAVQVLGKWMRGLMKPRPSRADVERLANGLSVEVSEISEWKSSYKYAPGSARKARLVTQLIVGRPVQDAIDLLTFTDKRAASMVQGVLKSAIANADEQEADVENLYVSNARVDDAGIRIGTKRWIPKDRGRAHPIHKKACHIHVTVAES